MPSKCVVVIAAVFTLLNPGTAIRLRDVERKTEANHRDSSCSKGGVPISGKVSADTGITEYSFRYGKAARWEEGQLVELPTSVDQIEATAEPRRCVQTQCVACGWDVGMFEGNWSSKKVEGDEDCLFLSVFTPKVEASEADSLLPVILHLHHGQNQFGFKMGHGDVKNVVQQGIVAVTANFRLGAMGMFAHPEVSQPNLIITDVILAMKWMQRYVCKLHGDPNHVTIAGSSSGAWLIVGLVASPPAKGLFHAVWANSPTAGTFDSDWVADKETVYNKMVKPCEEAAGCSNVECMRKLPAGELYKTFAKGKACTLGGMGEMSKEKLEFGLNIPLSKQAPRSSAVPNLIEDWCGHTLASGNVPIVVGQTHDEMDTLKVNIIAPQRTVRLSVEQVLEPIVDISESSKKCIVERMMAHQETQGMMEDWMFNFMNYIIATRTKNTGPRWHYMMSAQTSTTKRSWHTVPELITWGHDFSINTEMYQKDVMRSVFIKATKELKRFAHDNFVHFIKTFTPEDKEGWPQTKTVPDGVLGGIPSKDLSDNPDTSPIKQTFEHSNQTIKAWHSFVCNKEVPKGSDDGYNLQGCVKDPAHQHVDNFLHKSTHPFKDFKFSDVLFKFAWALPA